MATASELASTSKAPLERVPSRSAYAHLNRASAAKAIQHLDSYAFPDLQPSAPSPPLKRQKVSELVQSQSISPRTHRYSDLAGLNHVHRERARQRRNERLAAIGQGKGKEREGVNAGMANTYQPFSLPMLLDRLSTFSVSTYSSKPDACARLNPAALAMHGWRHMAGKEKDVLTCATCQAEWKVETKGEVSGSEERERAWMVVDDSVPSRHAHWCPWRLRGCHASLYRAPVHSRLATIKALIEASRALAQYSGIDQVQVSSSIAGDDQQALCSLFPKDVPMNCILLSLMGWKGGTSGASVEDCIVACSMCSRRIGLWGFLKGKPGSRVMHTMDEHNHYCPFVNGQNQCAAPAQGRRERERGEAKASSAWQQRLQVLLTGSLDDQMQLGQKEVRSMRSSEVLAKFKRLM